MEYERIPIILKRYDFGSKMNICQVHSKEVMSMTGLVSVNQLLKKPLPWELEAFALFSVMTTGEYSNRRFEDRQGRRQFVHIVNAIKDYEHPKLKNISDNMGFFERFLIVIGLTQFPLQEDIRFRLYRYSYIFNFENDKVNMKQHFIEKFGCEFKQFKKLGYIIQCLFSKELNRPLDSSIMEFVLKKYNHVIKHLTLDREDFVLLQKVITQDISQYVYGYNYFYQYPFIRYNQEIYLPLPHLIIHAITSSLLSRLTQGNNTLREQFGKEVLESYLLHLSNVSRRFDEIKSEYNYNFNRNERRTLDLMIRKGNQCLMMDSKSMSPKLSLRNLKENDVVNTVKRLVESIIQVYRHITIRFQNEYYPFDVKKEFSKKNIFGVVVLHEDSYIQREIIMMSAAEKLGIELQSEEYKYLCSNVKLISLYEFEQMMFREDDVLQLFTTNRDNPNKWFDLTLIPSTEEEGKMLREDVLPTIDSMKKIVADFANELVDAGILSRG